MKEIIKYTLSILGVVSAYIGLATLSFWYSFFNPTIYTNALSQSGFYTQVSGVIQDYSTVVVNDFSSKLAESLTSTIINEVVKDEKRSEIIALAVSPIVNDFIQEKTGEIVYNVSQAVQLESKVETFSNKIITDTVLWLRGDIPDPKFFAYIPTEEQVQVAEEQGVIRLVTVYFLAQSMGLTDLPDCQTAQEQSDNLQKINSGNLDQLTCTTKDLNQVLIGTLSQSKEGQLATVAQEFVERAFEHYDLTPMVDTIWQVLLGVASFKNYAYQAQSFIGSVKTLSVMFIVGSMFLIVGSSLLSEKKRLRYGFILVLIIGLMLSVSSIIQVLLAKEAVTNYVNIDNISLTNQIITPARNMMIVESIENTSYIVITEWFSLAFEIGIVLSIFSLVMILILSFIKFDKLESNIDKKLTKLNKRFFEKSNSKA